MTGGTKLTVRLSDRAREVSLVRSEGRLTARVDGRDYFFSIHEPRPGVYSLVSGESGGESVEASVAALPGEPGSFRVMVSGRSFDATVEKPGSAAPAQRERGGGGSQTIRALMPGRIVRVMARKGESVKRGQGLMVVEAMKMENEIASPKDGTVKELHVAPGARVESGAALAVVE